MNLLIVNTNYYCVDLDDSSNCMRRYFLSQRSLVHDLSHFVCVLRQLTGKYQPRPRQEVSITSEFANGSAKYGSVKFGDSTKFGSFKMGSFKIDDNKNNFLLVSLCGMLLSFCLAAVLVHVSDCVRSAVTTLQ